MPPCSIIAMARKYSSSRLLSVRRAYRRVIFYIAMAQQELETFQAHARVQQFTRKGMSHAVDRVTFMLQPCSTYILHKNIAGLSVP